MDSPYLPPPVPGPYSEEAEQQEKKQQQQDHSSQSDKAAAAVLIPADQLVLGAASEIGRKATLSSVTSSIGSQVSSTRTGTQIKVLNALGAAHATVNAAIGIVAVASLPIAAAVTALTAVIGPFAVIKIANESGIQNLSDVSALVTLIPEVEGAEKAVLAALDRISTAEPGQTPEFDLSGYISQARAESHPFVHATNNAPLAEVLTASIDENQANGQLLVRISDQEDGQRILALEIPAMDFEGMNFVDVPWSYTDHGGLTVTGVARVVARDVNEAPHITGVGADFDGQTLTVTLLSTDPEAAALTFVANGLTLPGNTLTFSVHDLAAGASPIEVVAYDPGGLVSAAFTFHPPTLAAGAEPVPPTILSYSLNSVAENESALLTVTAWDARDGLITQTYQISPQDYEAGQSLTLSISITNSSGLTVSAEQTITVTNANEIVFNGFRSGNIGAYAEGDNLYLDRGHGGVGVALFDFGFSTTDGQSLAISLSGYQLGYNPNPEVAGINYAVFPLERLAPGIHAFLLEARGQNDFLQKVIYVHLI